jgi:hypothetical protein
MKDFEIWIEGFAATGESSGAYFKGKVLAENFDEACIKLLGDRLDKNSDGSYRRGSYRGEPLPPSQHRAELMKGNFSIWACQLFDNEADARKSFG